MAARALALLGNVSSTSSLFRNLGTHFRPRRCYSSTSAADPFEKYVLNRSKSSDLTVSEALWLFDSILKVKPFPSILTLGNLFASLLRLGQCFTVLSMYTHLLRSRSVDFYPDVYTMNIVIKCFSETSNVRSGFCVLGTMVKAGIGYDSYTLNTLLDSLCKRGSMAEAVEWFEMIEREGLCDQATFGAMVDGFCKAGEPQKALLLLKKVIENDGPRPQSSSFASVVDSLCKNELVDEASCVFRAMIECGIRPDAFIYNSLILGLSRAGKWDKVAEILKDMKARGVSPDMVTFTVILDARFKEGSTVAALCLAGVMAEKRLLPKAVASCSFVRAACGAPKAEEVEILSGSTVARAGGGNGGSYVLNVFLNGLAAAFMMLECRELFEAMVGLGLVNEVGFTTVINGYCLEGEMDKAREVYDMMEINDSVPNTITYCVLANGYLKNRRLSDAYWFFRELVLRGLQPDESMVKILATILAYKRDEVFSTTLDQQQCRS